MIPWLMALLLGFSGLDLAGEAYLEGRFEEAFALYRAALEEPGVPQGPVLFNLGNCAFRLDRHAEAVLYYERAKLRLPRDPEVRFNLHLARQKLGITPPAIESFGAAVEALADAFTPGELLALVTGLQIVGLAGLALLGRRGTSRHLMALLVVLAMAGQARLVYTQWFSPPPAGVVLNREISLHTEPHADAAVAFKLRAGMKVRVEESSDRWARVTHPRGTGWTGRGGLGLVE